MDGELRSVLLASVRLLLRPIVRVLVKGGVPFREFSELAKFAYVEIATNEFGIRGRPTNVSRAAILTGLNRRDVARIRRATPHAMLEPSFMSPCSRILAGWHQDPAYLGPDGEPLILPLEGEAPSFLALTRVHAPDLPHIALYKELAAAGAVDLEPDGRLRVLKRSYVPNALDPNQIRLWGSILHDMSATLAHNVTRPPKHPALFERRAINPRLRREALPEFRAFLETEAQRFLERIDAWLTAHSVGDELAQGDLETVRAGAGAYLIEEPPVRTRRS